MMTRIAGWFRAIRDGRDDGMALITVVIFGTVLVMLVATAAAFASSGAINSRTQDDWNAAMSAAYAGVEDYKSRLANDTTYVQYRNSASTFSASSTGGLPPTTNPAFGVGTGGSWANVSSGTPGTLTRSYFRYEVDNSQYSASGTVKLRSTGKVGNEVRSIVVNVRQQGFIDFLYFTDFEVKDPAQSSLACNTSSGKPNYAWFYSTNVHDSDCTEIQFGPNDVINGPLHSNDTLLICGATFIGPVTTSNPKSPFYRKVSGCNNPTWSTMYGPPTLDATIGMPQTNLQMKSETRTDLDSVKRPGCLYTGPTVITFLTGGKMNVKSPFSKWMQVHGDPPTGGDPAPMCGTAGNVANGLGSKAGATIDVIPQNLIYVQDVPSTSDPNATAVGTWPANFTCLNTTSKTGWQIDTTRFPLATETVPSASPSHYGCRSGDVYVQGVEHGQVTVAAQNYVYITGDITYQDKTKDMLGIVGNNAVWVWNPFNDTTPLLAKDRTIYAAILSVGHTFMVQNYDQGNSSGRGSLNIYGAIAQEFRGTVGTAGGQGYIKNYNYDSRFKYTAPPKFLSPVSTTYGVSTLVEVPKAFKADGSVAG
ncbi:hypothetical protein [Leifsonia sp. NPDC058248]|uniref:hypothetical protein n=1 Tax=Leifsonia sp. NPDC058248 TaxID=3346402 RepID=UPI0036D9C43F